MLPSLSSSSSSLSLSLSLPLSPSLCLPLSLPSAPPPPSLPPPPNLQHEFKNIVQLGPKKFGAVVPEINEGLQESIIFLILHTLPQNLRGEEVGGRGREVGRRGREGG